MIQEIISNFMVSCDTKGCGSQVIIFQTNKMVSPIETANDMGWDIFIENGTYRFKCPECKKAEVEASAKTSIPFQKKGVTVKEDKPAKA